MNNKIEEQVQDTFDQMLHQYIGNALINVHTQWPAIVESFDFTFDEKSGDALGWNRSHPAVSKSVEAQLLFQTGNTLKAS